MLLLSTTGLFATEYLGVSIPKKYYDTVVEYCVLYGVPVIYFAKLVEWESRWDETCVTTNSNGTTDIGLLKLNSKYLADFSFRYNDGVPINPKDWKTSIKVGTKHLSVLRANTGSWFGAIAAYNMGLLGYTEWRANKRIMPESTKKELEFVFQ